jgi:hypothetical protein
VVDNSGSGVISIGNMSSLDTDQDEDDSYDTFTNGGTVTVDGQSDILTGDFSNAFTGALDVKGDSTADFDDLDNLGLIRIFGSSSMLSTLAGDGDTANGGQIAIDAGATWLNGDIGIGIGIDNITNANGGFGGQILVQAGGTVDALMFANPSVDSLLHVTNPGSAARLANITANRGTIRVDDTATLRAFDTTNNITGTLEVVSGATATLDDLDNRGLVRAFGAGSILSTLAGDGDTANGGQIIIDAGANWINGDQGARLVGTGTDNITNANIGFGGQIILQAGGTLSGLAFNNPQHDSLLHVSETGSAASATNITNSGTIRVDAGATITAQGFLRNNETGTVDIVSTAADITPTVVTVATGLGFVANSGLMSVNGPQSTLNVTAGAMPTTNILGQIVLDNGATWNNGAAVGGWVPITNGFVNILPPPPVLPGQILVSNASTFNSGAFTNNPGSLVKVSGLGSVINIFGAAAPPTGPVTNLGHWLTDPGGVTNSGTVANTGGTITVDGAGSKWNTLGNNWTNTNADVLVSHAGQIDLTTGGGLIRGFYNQAGGTTSIDGVGSTIFGGTTTLTGGASMQIVQGGVYTTAFSRSFGATDSAVTVHGAGSAVNVSSVNLAGSNVQIAEGASLSAPLGVTLGNNVAGEGSTVVVDGPGSSITAITPLLGTLSLTIPSTLVIGNGTAASPARVDALGGVVNAGLIGLNINGILNTVSMNNTLGRVHGTNSLVTTNGGAYNNTTGRTTMMGSSTLAVGALNNTGGAIEVSVQSQADSTSLMNVGAAAALASVLVNDRSTFNTGAVTNTNGSILVAGSSLFTTGPVGGPFAAMTNNSSFVTIDGGSLLTAGTYGQTGGVTTVALGSAASTGAYTLTGGELNLNNASALGGVGFPDTLITAGNFTSMGGAVSMLSGATARVNGIYDNQGGSITAAGASNLFTGTFTTTAGAIAFGGSSFLSTFGYTQSGGSLHIGGGAAMDSLGFTLTGGSVSLINASTVAGRPDTLDTLNFSNTSGAYSLLNGATARHRGTFLNASVTSLQGSSVQTRTTTNGGTISLEAMSTFRTNEDGVLNPFTNTGTVRLAGGSTATTGTFDNNFVAGTTNGDVVLEGGSTLRTGAFTDNGAVVLGTGSTLSTDATGPYLAFNIGGGSMVASDSGTFWDVGSVTQSFGNVRIQNGARGDTSTYSLTTGSLSLSSPASTGAPTLRVRGNFTNTGGAVNELNGATFRVQGTLTNASTISLQQGSSLRTRNINNDGAITLESMSTLSSDEDGPFEPLVNNGSINAVGGSTIKVGTTTSTAGAIALGGGALLSTSTYTQNGGSLHVGGGAAADTLDFSVTSGTVSLLNASTVAGFPDTLDTFTFINTGGAVSLNGGATANVAGAYSNLGGGTIVENGSTLRTQALTNTSSVTVRGGATLRTNQDTIFRTYDNTGGSTVVQGTGFLLTGDFTNDGGLLSVASATADVDVVSNAGPGHIEVNNAGLLVTDGVTSGGSISVLGGSTMRTNGTLAGFQTVTNTGTVVVAGGSTLSTASFDHSGSMSVSGGSTANFNNGLGVFVVRPGASVTIDNAGTAINTNITTILGIPLGGIRGVVKVNNNATLNGVTLNLFGTLDIDPAFANFSADANLDANGILRVDDYSRISVGDDVFNEMTDETHWKVDGEFRLNGSGFNEQTFEVAGYDFGNTTSGAYPTLTALWNDAYHDNFSIGDHDVHTLGTLHITPESIVDFVDGSDNSNSSSGGMDDFATQMPGEVITSTGALDDGEALYVNRLILGRFATLDLDKLHVYYRLVSFDDGATFVRGDFADVLAWQAAGIVFVPGSDGVTRYPIPFIPEPSTLLLTAIGTAIGVGRARRVRRLKA